MAGHRLSLLPGEKVLIDIRPHWSFLTGPLLVSLAAVAVGVTFDVAFPHTSVSLHWVEGIVVAVPCLWLAQRVVRWRTTRLILTSHRLVEQRGFASGRVGQTNLEDIISVVVVQSLVRRMIGSGRLELEIVGEAAVRWIEDVRKPVIFQRVVSRRLRPYGEPGSGGGRP